MRHLVGGRCRFLLVDLGFGLCFGLAFGLGFALEVGLLFGRLLARALEVGRVPAAPLQLKAGCTQQLLISLLPALRALRQRFLGDLLQVLFLVTAGSAAVFINRHTAILLVFKREYRLPCRRTCPSSPSLPRL